MSIFGKKQPKYKVLVSSSVLTELELNTLYEKEKWELLQVIIPSKNNFYHIFKRRV